MALSVAKAGSNQIQTKSQPWNKMSAPTSRQEVQTFLSLANCMGPFIPARVPSNLNALTAPLRELIKESHQFDWSLAHQEAYKKVKTLSVVKSL